MNNYGITQQRVLHEWNSRNLTDDAHVWRHFMICCANLTRFRPDIAKDEMPGIFRRMNANMHMAAINQSHPDVWEAVDCKGCGPEWLDKVRQEPGLITTYHTGSYRLLPRLLAQHGIPFALLLAREVRAEQGPLFHSQYQALQDSAPMRLIDAEEPGALFAMRKALRSGSSILAYIDGNSGAVDMTSTKHATAVRFFDAQLQVRTGIGYLAGLTDRPVYPVCCSRLDASRIEFTTYPEVRLGLGPCRQVAVTKMMQTLYRYLEEELRQRPESWEGWGYLHPIATPAKHRFRIWCGSFWKENCPFPLQIGGSYYALHARSWQAYPIGRKSFDRLSMRHLKRMRMLGETGKRVYL